METQDHQELLRCANVRFLSQVHVQVPQHQHQDHLHRPLQREEGEARGAGVPSETSAAADLPADHQHPRQHRPPHEPAALAHRHHQVPPAMRFIGVFKVRI